MPGMPFGSPPICADLQIAPEGHPLVFPSRKPRIGRHWHGRWTQAATQLPNPIVPTLNPLDAAAIQKCCGGVGDFPVKRNLLKFFADFWRTLSKWNSSGLNESAASMQKRSASATLCSTRWECRCNCSRSSCFKFIFQNSKISDHKLLSSRACVIGRVECKLLELILLCLLKLA